MNRRSSFGDALRRHVSTSAFTYTTLSRLDEAEAVYKQAEERKLGERAAAPEPLHIDVSEG